MACRNVLAHRRIEICDDLGADMVWPFLMKTPAGAVIPIDVGDTIRMTIRDQTTNDLEWELDTDAEIVITNYEGGAGEVHFNAADKDTVTIAAGTYNFAMMLDHGGSEQVTHSGVYELGPDINGEAGP